MSDDKAEVEVIYSDGWIVSQNESRILLDGEVVCAQHSAESDQDFRDRVANNLYSLTRNLKLSNRAAERIR